MKKTNGERTFSEWPRLYIHDEVGNPLNQHPVPGKSLAAPTLLGTEKTHLVRRMDSYKKFP